jgi:hypothetical protein
MRCVHHEHYEGRDGFGREIITLSGGHEEYYAKHLEV